MHDHFIRRFVTAAFLNYHTDINRTLIDFNCHVDNWLAWIQWVFPEDSSVRLYGRQSIYFIAPKRGNIRNVIKGVSGKPTLWFWEVEWRFVAPI